MPCDMSVLCLGVLTLVWMLNFLLFVSILSDIVLSNENNLFLLTLLLPLTLLWIFTSPWNLNLALNLEPEIFTNLDLDLDLDLKLYLDLDLVLEIDKPWPWPNKLHFSLNHNQLLVIKEVFWYGFNISCWYKKKRSPICFDVQTMRDQKLHIKSNHIVMWMNIQNDPQQWYQWPQKLACWVSGIITSSTDWV